MESLENITASAILNKLPRVSKHPRGNLLCGIYVFYKEHPNGLHIIYNIFRASGDADLCEQLFSFSDQIVNMRTRSKLYDFYSSSTKREIENAQANIRWGASCVNDNMRADPYFYFYDLGKFPPGVSQEVVGRFYEIILNELRKVRQHVVTLSEYLRLQCPVE